LIEEKWFGEVDDEQLWWRSRSHAERSMFKDNGLGLHAFEAETNIHLLQARPELSRHIEDSIY